MDFQKDVVEQSASQAVLVDFWAPWCGPCRMLGPVLEDLEKQAGGKWKLVKINVDDHPELAQTYGIRSIPAVKIFKAGKVVEEFVGVLPADRIEQTLNPHL